MTKKKNSPRSPDSPVEAESAPSSPTAHSDIPSNRSEMPSEPEPPAPENHSGTWFQEEDPQILIQWTIAQAPQPEQVFESSGAGSATPSYQSRVRLYQLVFATEIPDKFSKNPNSSIVPFSVVAPSMGPTPYLEGSFDLSQDPLRLEVLRFRFPGFTEQNVTLYPTPTHGCATGESELPAESVEEPGER